MGACLTKSANVESTHLGSKTVQRPTERKEEGSTSSFNNGFPFRFGFRADAEESIEYSDGIIPTPEKHWMEPTHADEIDAGVMDAMKSVIESVLPPSHEVKSSNMQNR